MPIEVSILKRFGIIVRNHRNAIGMSQEDLAEASGLHRTYIGMIERGEKNISIKNIEKIATGLGISISKLTEDL